MAIIKKFGDVLTQNLNTYRTFITDTNPNSEYFRVTEFKETFTGGKNGFLIEGSQYLKESTEIKIQILDVNGNPIYYEPASGTPEYYEGVSTLIAVYVYEDTPIGLANITILGELKKYIDDDGVERDVPDDWKGVYNVKWEKSFKVNRLIRNEDRVRFYRKPGVTITEIVKPLFSNVVATITKSGSLNGIPLNPIAGTKLTDYTLPTSYLLRLNDGSAWTGSIVGNRLSIPQLDYTPLATDVVNNTDLIVSNPYVVGGVVNSFTSASYTASFNYVEGVDNLATALTGSFAKIKLSELTTFVGDVARVKVFRKSQSDLSDYQFIQEIQLESNEVLLDLESQTKNQEFYGLFDSNVITEYWVTSSNNITPSFNQNVLFNSVKLTNTGTNFYFTSKSLDISKDIEYTLNFNVIRDSVQNGEYFKVFLSGSRESSVNGSPTTIQIEQTIINISSDSSLLQKTNSSTNFVAEEINNAKLYFEVNGGPWYVSDVSVRASQESSFSPDELTFIQPVPRTLPAETFDFLFQFYDINNNYIPVVVEESKTFNGGNLNAINKSIELVPSSLYFQFDSGSNGGNPVPPTTIFIDVVKNFLTGSTNFTSRSFDFFNNELSSSQYAGGVFPGLLEDFNLDTVKLTVENFTGSVAPGNPEIIVQFIEYTAECEGVSDSIIITRVQDGKGGVNYEIRPYNGTVIRNSDASSSLEVQAIRIDGVNEIKLRSGLEDNRSDYKLHIQSGSTYITLTEASSSGFVRGLSAGTTGSGELDYNALFTRDSIDGQRTVYLIPSSSNNLSASIVTALTLTDLQDGLDAGVVLFDANNFTINPRTQTLFTPVFSSATASFYRRGTFENPISCSFEVYPSMSINADFVPEYWMYFITHSCDPNIGVVAYDEFGNIIPSLPLGSYVGLAVSQSKQLLTSFTYTEPFTSASVNVDQLFTIIPEGKPGDEPIVFEIVPSTINLKSDSRGFIADYNSSITDIKLKQGARYLIFTGSREPGTFHIATGSIIGRNITPGNVYFDVNYTSSLIVSASSNMTDLSGSVEYPLEIQPYYTSSVYTASVFQQFTKVLDGPPPIEFIFSPQNVILSADEVGYVSDYAAGNTDIQVKEGDDYLTFTTQSNSPGSWRILSVTTTNIQTSSLSSSSFDNATVTFDRFDYPYVSASAVYSIRVNPYSLGPGHQYTSSIYTRTQSFTKNVAPPAARGVSLISTAETVTFDGDGVVVSPLGDIRLTATAFNTTGSVYYQFFRDGSPYSAIQSDDFYDISSGDAVNPGQIATWRVDIRDGSSSPSAPVRAQAEVTIAGIQAGAEAYTVVLTNENSSISADLWDVNFTGSNNTISAFKGTTQLIHTNSFSPKTQDLLGNDIGSLGEYQVTIFSTSSFITPGSGLGSGSILTTVGSSAFIGDLGGWTTPGLNTSGEIVYKIDIENGRQTFFKTQSFGVNIEPAAPYVVEVSNQNTSVVYKVSGQLTVDGTGTTIRAFRGGTELNNASSSFSTPQLDIYGNTGYRNQYRVTVNSVPAYIDLAGSIVSGSELLSNPAQIGNIDGWTSANTNLTGEVVYKVELEGRETILKSQNFGVQLEGETGPGIVMRGQWNEITNYIGSVETTNNRRDAVIYPDPSGSNGETHYFMALSGSGPATVGPQIPPSPNNDTDYWQYLGQQDFFVSAKLAIFEESFVKNTINVGNNPGSSFANIVIAGGRTDPYLAIGQGGTQGATGTSGFSVTGSNILGYNQPGIFLGMYENGGAGTTGRFSIKSAGGTAGTRGLFWDGDVLTIVGAIRQVQPGQNEGGLRGLWSAGLIYYPDDIVTYQDQTWVMTGATHTSTNDSNALTGVPGSGPWTIAAAAGTSGTAGVPKTVVLSAESYVIAYDADGNNPNPSSTIKLEATSSGFTNGYFKFTGGGTNFTDETSYTDGEGQNTDSATLNIPSTYFSTPLTFRVGVSDGDQTELTSDTITVFAVKPGADVSPQYMITPLTGTQIKNGTGTITLQVQQSDSTGLSNVTSGTGARLYKNDSSLLAVSMSGITDGGNGVTYNPTIDASAIEGTLVLELRDNSDNVLDTITLIDVTDGLGGGSFIAPSMQMTRVNKTTTYAPSFLSVTSSFFSTNGTEYTSSFRIFASASGVSTYTDNMYFDEGDQNPNISYTANNGDGITFSGPGFTNSLPTKDLSIVATFTDPSTSQTTTASETFYVVSEGADGIDAITIINTNQAHTLPSANDGTVSSYVGSGLDISVYEGTSSLSYDGVGTSAATWKVSSSISPDGVITIGSITDNGDDITIGDHSSMNLSEDLALITYTITGTRIGGDGFSSVTTQTITKAKAGADGPAGTSGAAAKSVRLTSEAYVISYDENGSNPSPSGTIKLEASSSNFTNAYFKFTGGGTNFTDETTFTDGTDANNDFATLTIPSSYFTGPLTFRVGVSEGDQVEISNDSLSIVAVKPGADVSPQYMITPLSGTQIKNGGGSITLQVQQSDSTGLADVTSGTFARLYKNDSSLLATSMSGITDAGNGVVYNPTIDSDAINGSLILELRDASDNVLDSITLVDVTDGLGGGSFLAPSLQMTRVNKSNTYTPSFLSATASFFSTNGTEYSSSFRIFASASGVTEFTDNIYFDEGYQDGNISYVANNGDGIQYVGPGFANSLATKDINFVATFTDPNTGQTTTASETFYVVSDGADGIDAITVVAGNTAHTLPAGSDGVVSDYVGSGIDILIYEGTASLSYDGVGTSAQTWKIGTPYVSPIGGITVGSITDGGNNAVVGDHSSMNNAISLVSITYPITGSRKNGDQFLTEVVQSLTKAVAGISAKALTVTSDSQVFVFDDSLDNSAADPIIRVYFNQQNLSGTVARTDITLVDGQATTLTTPFLTGSVSSGTGEQYFDIYFDTGSAGGVVNVLNNKNQLPLSITVQKDSITDSTTISKLEGGASNAPMYFISPVSGTQIKNGTGKLELKILESGPGGITTIGSGDKKLYSGSALITTVSGVTGTDYNAIIDASAITGSLIVTLKDGSILYDSVTLVDVTDGLGGGSFITPSMNASRKSGDTTYTPTFLSATASFFDTSGTEYTKAVRLYPTFSADVDNFYYVVDSGAHTDTEIVLTLDDGDGTPFAGAGSGNMLPTKDVNITAVFTDPATGQTNTITETLYIVSDGADGVDAITIISTNQSHTFAASSVGVVGDYTNSGTEITLYEGTASLVYDGVGTTNGTWKIGTPYVNPSAAITVGSITDGGDYAIVGDHSSMNNATTQLSITYPITGSRLKGGEFKVSTTQTITKANQGVDAKALTVTGDAQVFVFDDSLDNKAADDTIRIYINQQNLSGTVARTDITLVDAQAVTLTTPFLTGSVSSGTGEQYFDIYFDTGSAGGVVNVLNNKNQLPLSITVQKDSITDSTTISKLEGGASNAPMYFISPISGTQIKNGSGQLELRILESGPGGLSTISSGDKKLYSGSALITTVSGVTGTDYNAIINSSAITGSLIVTLKDGSVLYDSVTLIDVTDGLGGGSFLSPSLNTTRQNGTTTYTPSFLSLTASFFDTSGTEYTKAVRLIPTYSANVDNFYFENNGGPHNDSQIVLTLDDGDGTTFAGAGSGNLLPTKDVNVTAVFTDPATGQTNTMNETVYIVSDGQDGVDAITIISTNQSHTFAASSVGVVGDYTNSGTEITLYEGTASLAYDGVGTTNGTWKIGTPYVNPSAAITVGSITDGGDYAIVGDHSSMNNATTQLSITYPITGSRLKGGEFKVSTTQTITKANQGVDAKALTVTGDAQVFVFDDSLDNKAADDTIRIYINQQNLSATVERADITITDALAGSLIVPWLTGSVSSGTGEQYFDLYFNTGSSAVGYIDSKAKLPITITVQQDSITDSTSIAKLEGGASNAPMYFISPISGTQVKNGTGQLQFKILESAPGSLSEVITGNIKLYSGSNLITTYGGVTGTDYNAIVPASTISGSMVIVLKDATTVYDSITVVDVTDGLGGGSFLASALNTIRQTNNTYLPSYLSATASFFDVNGTEYTKAWRITPNFDSGTDYMYYDNDSGAHTDSQITFTINDGDGTNYSGTGIGNKLPTKDLNIVATFTDPQTGQTNTMTETFYIVSDGQDGLDAITIISNNQAHTVPASNAGVVSSYLGSGTTISVYEGTGSLSYDGVGSSAGTWTISSSVSPTAAITVGSITDNGDTATISDHSGMSNSEDVVTITYTILGKRFANTPFTASSAQTITKAKIGASGTSGTTGAAGSPGAGVVYRGEFAGTTAYFHTTTRRDVVRYAANYYLTANTGLNSSAGTDWGTPGSSTSWESFGAQFSSVATDILLAQDVYADRTVNVGASGSSPVIQLYADYPTNANPAIKINLGTQGYAGTGGIFIGFDSATPKLSLVNSNNTKYIKWTGSDLEVKGTINADAGLIGGFSITSQSISSSNNNLILKDSGQITGSSVLFTGGVIGGFQLTDYAISSSQYITSGSGTSFNAQPKLSLKANGEISGSAVRILRKSGDDFYTLMDTTYGILDAANLGRQVVSDSNEYELRGINTGTTYVEVASYPFVLLPYENKISVDYNLYGNKGGASTVAHSVRFVLEKHPTIGISFTSNYYDNWYGEQIIETVSQTLSAQTEFSLTYPNSGSLYTHDVPSSVQNRFVHLKVLLLSNVTSGTANSSTVTKIKNLSVVTHRGFASAVATEIGEATEPPGGGAGI